MLVMGVHELVCTLNGAIDLYLRLLSRIDYGRPWMTYSPAVPKRSHYPVPQKAFRTVA